MNKYLNKVMIIDGSYMLHRALHTPAFEELKTSTGIKSGGVFGFLRILQAEVRKFPGYFPIVCWDKGLSSRRTELYPDYKANRERLIADSLIGLNIDNEQDEYLQEYHRQRSDTIQILKSLGIPSIIIPGWEGDDLQYLLSKVCDEGIIITDDKDLIQLVSPSIKIRRPMKDEMITWEDSDAYYRHPRFTIRKAIVGDGSDNIPKSAKGVGDTGADQISQIICEGLELTSESSVDLDKIKKFLIEYVDRNEGKLIKKVKALLDGFDQFSINYQLTDLRLVESPVGFEHMIKDLITGVLGKPRLFEAYSLIGKYEMNSIFPDQIIAMISLSSSVVLK